MHAQIHIFASSGIWQREKNQQFENQHFKSTCTEFHLFFWCKNIRVRRIELFIQIKIVIVKKHWCQKLLSAFMKYKGYEKMMQMHDSSAVVGLWIFFSIICFMFFIITTLCCVLIFYCTAIKSDLRSAECNVMS